MKTHQQIVDRVVEAGIYYDPMYWWANDIGEEVPIQKSSMDSVKYMNEKGLLGYAVLNEWIDLDTYLDWMRRIRNRQVVVSYDSSWELTWIEATLVIDGTRDNILTYILKQRWLE